MASVFKAKGAAKYTILYFDENGDRRKKAGYADKRASQELGNKLETEARRIKDGLDDPKDKAYRNHEATLLVDHLADYERFLVAKGGSPRHAHETVRQSTWLLETAKARRISEISLSKTVEAVSVLRSEGANIGTANHYICAVKGFSRWLWKDNRAREHHLAHLATSSSEGDRRHVRRALTAEEAAKVVRAAELGSEVRNMSGTDRAMLYAVALGTGFRADELRTLTPELFKLEANPPTVTALAAYTKNGREAVQPLAVALADRLRPWLATKPPGKAVFGELTERSADMLKVDLEAAGIPYETDSGVVDFHALRGCYISYLVSSGASVKTCQTLARHATPSLTIGIYAKASLHDIDSAVEGLPDLTSLSPELEKQTLAATGTDGATGNATFAQEAINGDSAQVQCLKLNSIDLDGRKSSDRY